MPKSIARVILAARQGIPFTAAATIRETHRMKRTPSMRLPISNIPRNKQKISVLRHLQKIPTSARRCVSQQPRSLQRIYTIAANSSIVQATVCSKHISSCLLGEVAQAARPPKSQTFLGPHRRCYTRPDIPMTRRQILSLPALALSALRSTARAQQYSGMASRGVTPAPGEVAATCGVGCQPAADCQLDCQSASRIHRQVRPILLH